MAWNHTRSGIRLRWKMVPAVTDCWYPQPRHIINCRLVAHPPGAPQRGHRNPSGHRSRAKYVRQAASDAKRSSISDRLRGESSMPRNTTDCGYWSQGHTTYVAIRTIQRPERLKDSPCRDPRAVRGDVWENDPPRKWSGIRSCGCASSNGNDRIRRPTR